MKAYGRPRHNAPRRCSFSRHCTCGYVDSPRERPRHYKRRERARGRQEAQEQRD